MAQGWKQLRAHPLVFVPDLLFLFLTTLFGLLLFFSFGIDDIVNNAPAFPDISTLSGTNPEELFVDGQDPTAYIEMHFPTVLKALLLFILGVFLLSSFGAAMKYPLLHAIMANKKVSFSDLFRFGRASFWPMVGLRLMIFVLYLFALAGSAMIFILLFPVNKSLAFVFAAIVALGLVVFFLLGLYFRYPLFCHHKTGVFSTIKHSFSFFRTHKMFVLRVAMMIGILFFLCRALFTFVSQWSFMVSLGVLQFIVFFVLDLWMNLYLFSAYTLYEKKSVKIK